MVYSQKLVACIKVNGQVLRETGDSVSIPFGSEYSILLKNLNSVRVQIKVSVDGTDATEGTWLIIQPNSSLELKRFIRNGNLNSGNRFRFIPRTKKIEQHRGLKADDGLIRIEYQTEKIVQTQEIHTHHYDHHHPVYPTWPVYPKRPWWDKPWYDYPYTIWCQNADLSSGVIGSTTTGGLNTSVYNSNVTFTANNASAPATRFTKSSGRGIGDSSHSVKAMSLTRCADVLDDSGITVPGSESHQQFFHTSSFPVHATSEVLVIRLKGEVAGKKVTRAVTVKSKLRCGTCGKANRGTTRFCSECGTALSLI